MSGSSKKSGLFGSISLRSFLCNVTSEQTVQAASEDLTNIFESFHVIPELGDTAGSWLSFVHGGQRCNINETLRRIISQIVRTSQQGKKETQNVLCLGYQRLSADSTEAKMRDSLDVGFTHINSVLSFLRTDEWERFTQRFGMNIVMIVIDNDILIYRCFR